MKWDFKEGKKKKKKDRWCVCNMTLNIHCFFERESKWFHSQQRTRSWKHKKFTQLMTSTDGEKGFFFFTNFCLIQILRLISFVTRYVKTCIYFTTILDSILSPWRNTRTSWVMFNICYLGPSFSFMTQPHQPLSYFFFFLTSSFIWSIGHSEITDQNHFIFFWGFPG